MNPHGYATALRDVSFGPAANGAVPANPHQVAEQMDVLGKVLGEHSELLAQLASRLDPVLRPCPPEAVAGCLQGGQPPTLAPLAERLATECRAIEGFNLRVRDLLSRLAV